MAQTSKSSRPDSLPPALENHPLTGWISDKGWAWFPHQVETLRAIKDGHDVIVFAPTGAGKTLSGFLPSLVDLHETGSSRKLHTLYISPLKALAVDVHRNIGVPQAELDLDFRFETRTGDTLQYKRRRQRTHPPDILMTTPESLALITSYDDAEKYFGDLKYIIIDELHAFLHSKRADLLSLNIERLQSFSPMLQRIGLSATLADQNVACDWLCRKDPTVITAPDATRPDIRILQGDERMPWSGHSARYAMTGIYEEVRQATMAIVFVNTRAQAEFVFQNLWTLNEDKLKIAVHHGSLDQKLRRKVEAEMARGSLDCVVATASLDLGLDWAAVDLVIQVGAPKGVSRLLQRIGRSNHRLDQPSRAVLVPTNRFEYLECKAAVEEIARGKLDGIAPKDGGLDVLAQHIFGVACAGPFEADSLYETVTKAWPYRDLKRQDFDDVLDFVSTGGYALRAYDRFSRIVEDKDNPGVYRLRDKKDTRRYRMNVGTIVEAPLLTVTKGNRRLGKIEESFIQNLSPGDTFLFGGEVVAFETIHNDKVLVRKTKDKEAKVPSYAGGRMPLSTHLADVVRGMLGHPAQWTAFPSQIGDWLTLHQTISALPDKDTFLVETFPRAGRFYTVIYSFAGRNANNTLGFLLMRRMKRQGLRPLGFAMTDYALALWSLQPPEDIPALLTPDLMFQEFEDWLQDTPLTRRLFRDAAVIAGLVERRHPGKTKTGRQVLMSTDLIFDVLMKHDPDHILLRAAYEDAKHGMIDAGRVREFLLKIQDKIEHRTLDKVSPLAVPVILQIGRESMARKDCDEYILEDMEAEILEDAGVAALD